MTSTKKAPIIFYRVPEVKRSHNRSLKVSKIQNEFKRSSFLPKCKPKITRVSALPNKKGSQPKKVLRSLFVCSRISYRNGWNTEALIFENLKPVDNQKIISTSFEHLKKKYKFSKLGGCDSIIKPATPILVLNYKQP